MSSFTPLRQTYSALLSSLPSSDDSHSAINLKKIVKQSSESQPRSRTVPRYSFLIRVIIFVLLESGFIALVSAALHRPIFLHFSFSNNEVKGAVTAIAIVWHALAVYVVKDILLNVFSAEWIEQYDGSQSLTLQDLDVVSRLTTGFIDQVKHCSSQRATHPFRLSFLSFLLLILLNGLGPSAIGLDLTPYNYSSTIQVANLTMGVIHDAVLGKLETEVGIYYRANTILQLEVVENAGTVGFSGTEPNILIPWPSSNSMSKNMTMNYESDVVRFNFNCSWKAPSNIDADIPLVWSGDNELYFPDTIASSLISPSIWPLTDIRYASPIYFLFVGENGVSLNLEGVPSLGLFCNNEPNPLFVQPSSCKPSVVSMLVCDPQFKVLPATITATGSSLDATLLSGSPTVKNILIDAVNFLFSSAFLFAASPNSLNGYAGISPFSYQLFFSNGPFNGSHNMPYKPLSLDEINQNLTKALASAAKAYLNGFFPTKDDPMAQHSFATANTSAVIKVQKLALVGRRLFFIASSAIVGLLVVLLGAIVVIMRPDHMESFDLENIVGKLQ